jgi:hypothetical protein
MPHDMSTNFLAFSRIVNNVTMAMPHAGIYVAANDPVNDILQPSNLNGQSEYKISASVLSPAVNVLCAEISGDELELLISSTPLNSTSPELDDLFQWGSVYGRAPPVFPLVSPSPSRHSAVSNRPETDRFQYTHEHLSPTVGKRLDLPLG